MAITTASGKAKGRRLQQFVRDRLLKLFPQLSDTDVISCPMGSRGTDVILSRAAQALIPFSIECKARAKGFTALYDAIDQATRDHLQPIAIVKQDRRKPLVVIDLDAFLTLVKP